jgi:hypothetical protein
MAELVADAITLRRVLHFAVTMPVCGNHKTPLASDAGLDPEAQLFQLCPDSQAEAGLARVDQHGDCRAGSEEA